MSRLLLILFTFLRSNYAGINKLNLSNQQFTENVLISNTYQNSGLGFEYGMWTKYQPLSNINQLGTIDPTTTDCSLFHFIAISDMEQLIYYLCFHNENTRIEHSVQLISYNQMQFKQSLIIENDYHYEGVWIYYHLASIPKYNKFIIFIGTLDEINISYQQYDDYLPFKDDQLRFYYGNCREVINDKFKPLTLASFRGPLILYTISYDLDINSIHFTQEKILQFWQDQVNYQTFYEYSRNIYYNAKLEIVQEYEKSILTQYTMGDSFVIQGWFKLEGELARGKDQEFLTLKPTHTYQNYKREFTSAQTTLSYFQPNYQTNQVHLQTYSYTFPNVNVFKTTMTSISKFVTISLQKWHFIFLKFVNDQITLHIFQNQEYQATYTLRQFSGYSFKIILGGQFANTNTKLYAYLLNTDFYKPNVLTFNFQIECDYSCLTCSGPTRFDCESCFTTGCENCTISNCPEACRIFISNSKTCACNPGYFDYQSMKCLGVAFYGYTLQINNQIIPSKNCDPNYFNLNGECRKCPEIRNKYIQSCYSCENDWSFICAQQLVSLEGDPNFVYRLDYSNNVVYLFNHEEHILCEFCQYKGGNQEYKYLHLGQPSYVNCKYKYEYFQKECILSIRIVETYDYTFSSELACNDPSQAYLSFFNNNQCLPCLIENCKYCFDYSQLDNSINSYQSNLDELDYDDIVTGCALCYPGYVYNQKTRTCEIHIQPDYCKTAILNNGGETNCLISNNREIEAISYTDCSDLIDYCIECMIIPEGNICTICQLGYYYNFLQGICMQTTDSAKFQIISYISEVQPFYYYLLKKLLMQTDENQNAIKCKVGYSLTSQKDCRQNQPDTCVQQYDSDMGIFICKQLTPTVQGVYLKPIYEWTIPQEDVSPTNCTAFCQHCQYDPQILQLNPQYTGTQTMKCMLSYNNMQIDSDYGRVLIYPNLSLKYTKNVKCQLPPPLPPLPVPHRLLINHLDPQANLFDLQSLRSYIYEVLIDEDISDSCEYNYVYNFNFKDNILTMKDLILIISSKQDKLYKIGKQFLQISTIYFNIFELHNLIIKVTNPLTYLFTLNMTILFTNISFQGTYEEQSLEVIFPSFTSIQLINTEFYNLSFSDSILLKYKNQLIDSQSSQNILFQNITFKNCLFQNSQLIELYPNAYQVNITIQMIKFINVTFINSKLINSDDLSNQYTLNITTIILTNCHFYSSSLIRVPNNFKLMIYNFEMINTIINSSDLVYITLNTNLQNFSFENCSFVNTTKLFYSLFNQLSVDCQIHFFNFSFKSIQLQTTNIINFKPNLIEKMNFSLSNFDHTDIIDTSTSTYPLYSITQLEKEIDLAVGNQKVTISDFQFRQFNEGIPEKISFWSSCFTAFGISQLFQLAYVQYVQLDSMVIQNNILKDTLVISIIDSMQVDIFNIDINSNMLISQQSRSNLGIIKISSAYQSQVHFNNVILLDNIIHSYATAQQVFMGIFLAIDAQYSEVRMNNNILSNNYVSQSTSPFLSIDCAILMITSFECQNNNIKINENLIMSPSSEYNSAYISDMIDQRFQVLSNTGVGILSFNSLNIQNSSFINGYSEQISIFKLILKNDTSITMNNIIISNYSSSLQKDKLFYGCFVISNSNFDLNASLNNITISEISSRSQSAFLYFEATTGQNQVYITNCKIKNIFSLKNGLISMDLKESFSINNLLFIKNVTITNDESNFLSYLQSLISLSDTELQLLQSKSGLVFISNSKVIIKDFEFSGHLGSPLFEFNDCYDVIMKQVTLFNIFTQSSLLIISQKKNYSVNIYKFKVNNVKQLISDISSKHQIEKQQYEFSSQIECKMLESQDIESIFQNHYYQIDPQHLIFSLQSVIPGFFRFSQDKNNLRIQDSLFEKLTCTQCQYGGIFIDSKNNSDTTIINTVFKKNQYFLQGCVYNVGDQSNSIQISTCKFVENQCQEGCGIVISESSLAKIANCRFIKNTAIDRGGGLLYNGLNLTLISNFFINNTAQIGSAVYLNKLKLDSQQLDSNNFINNSEVQIREMPSYLDCLFNNNKLPKATAQNDTVIVDFAYDIIYLPSSIAFSEYQRFNEQTLQYEGQNFSLQFVPLNQINEAQTNYYDSNCKYKLFIYENETKSASALLLEKQINFISDIQAYEIETVIFDPYKPNNYILQIVIQCEQIGSYSYYLNAKTYFCQMGEYYSQEGCHYCDYTKGYYTVKSNSSKCSQIDTNKVASNKANLLKLKQGFWRIDSHSEQIETCSSNSCLGGWDVGQASCQEGYIGALCQECDLKNYYSKSQSNTCLPCEESWGSIISLILLSLWMIISIALTVKSVQNANQQFKLLLLTNRFYQILSKYNQDVPGCLIKMLQNSMLIVGAVYSIQEKLTINMNWVEQFSAATLTNAFSLDCWFSRQEYIDVLYLRMFLLVLLSLFFISFFVSGYLVYISIKKSKYDSSTLIIAIIYIFIITQPDNIKYSSSLAASRTISDVRWVQQDISYLYDTDTHYHWIILAVIPLIIIWGVIIPLFLGFILFHNRKHLHKITFRRKWSYLFQEYQTNSYFWEIVKIISRELQVLVLTVFKQEILNNICLLFFIEFIYLTLIGKIQPYNMEELNQLEIQSVQKSILILILGLFTYSTSNSYIKTISEFMLIFTTLSLMLPFLYKLLKIYFKKYLIEFKNIIQKMGFMKKLLKITSQDLDKRRRARERFQKVKAKLLDRVQTFQRFERVYNESLITDQTTNTFNQKIKKISLQMA